MIRSFQIAVSPTHTQTFCANPTARTCSHVHGQCAWLHGLAAGHGCVARPLTGVVPFHPQLQTWLGVTVGMDIHSCAPSFTSEYITHVLALTSHHAQSWCACVYTHANGHALVPYSSRIMHAPAVTSHHTKTSVSLHLHASACAHLRIRQASAFRCIGAGKYVHAYQIFNVIMYVMRVYDSAINAMVSAVESSLNLFYL